MASQGIYKHVDTPIRSEIRALRKIKGNTYEKLAEKYKIAISTVRRVIAAPSARRHGHDGPERRGRKQKYTDEDLDRMVDLITKNGWDRHNLRWSDIPLSLDGDVPMASYNTIRSHLQRRSIGYFIAKSQPQIEDWKAKKRLEWAIRMLQLRPNPADWEDVLWSDKCHFGWGPEGPVRILRAIGTRNNVDCILIGTRSPSPRIRSVYTFGPPSGRISSLH